MYYNIAEGLVTNPIHFVNVFFFSGQLFRLHFIYFFHLFFSWRLITLQYCSGFCHTLSMVLTEVLG